MQVVKAKSRPPTVDVAKVAPLVNIEAFNQQRQQEVRQSMKIARAAANQYRRENDVINIITNDGFRVNLEVSGLIMHLKEEQQEAKDESERRAMEWSHYQKERTRILGQVQQLEERLQDWCQEHASEISMACLVPSMIQNKLWFVVMKKDRCYSQDFARELTKLEIDIEDSESFDSIELCVMDFPNMPENQFEQAIMELHTS